MSWRICVLIVVLFLRASIPTVDGQSQKILKKAVNPNLDCISRFRLPIYGPIAESSRGGTVDARILLDSAGKLQSVDLQATDTKLKGEISLVIADAEFKSTCGGNEVALRFVFKDSGQRPGGVGVWKTYFLPPNTFEIVGTHPPPSFDPGRPIERH
jgi:hypothetical protein